MTTARIPTPGWWVDLLACHRAWSAWAADFRSSTTEADRAFALLALRYIAQAARALTR